VPGTATVCSPSTSKTSSILSRGLSRTFFPPQVIRSTGGGSRAGPGGRETLLAVTVPRAAFSLTFLAAHTFWPLLIAVAWVLSCQSAAPYHGAFIVNSLTCVVSAALLARLPHVPPVPAARRQVSTAALPQHPLHGDHEQCRPPGPVPGTSVQRPAPVAEGGHHRTGVDRPLAVLVSSLLIDLFQVRVTRIGQRLAGAVRASWRAGVALAGCCLAFAAAAWPAGPVPAAVVVLVGLGLHVLGELYYVAARWGLSIKPMAHGAQSQYQAVAATTEGAVVAVGPALVTMLVTGAEGTGWAILALVFLTCSLPVAPLCRPAPRRTAAGSVRESSPGLRSTVGEQGAYPCSVGRQG
jgi:hypothetical protein